MEAIPSGCTRLTTAPHEPRTSTHERIKRNLVDHSDLLLIQRFTSALPTCLAGDYRHTLSSTFLSWTMASDFCSRNCATRLSFHHDIPWHSPDVRSSANASLRRAQEHFTPKSANTHARPMTGIAAGSPWREQFPRRRWSRVGSLSFRCKLQQLSKHAPRSGDEHI